MAIATTFVTYIGYGLMIGSVGISQASGDETEYIGKSNLKFKFSPLDGKWNKVNNLWALG